MTKSLENSYLSLLITIPDILCNKAKEKVCYSKEYPSYDLKISLKLFTFATKLNLRITFGC